MRLPLQIQRLDNKNIRNNVTALWRDCEPFVENKNGQLIHRPRIVTAYKIGSRWPGHISISYWCGMHQAGCDKFIFLAQSPEGKFVCKNCEIKAVEAGLPTSSQLSGRNVCIGGVKAYSICHPT